MHDPMVVAHEVPSPLLDRKSWMEREAAKRGKRWGWLISRRTNPENLGERTYPWWRPHGRKLVLAGRVYGLKNAITIWHVEPRGRDALDVCGGMRVNRRGKKVWRRSWRWHIHHWRIQVHYLGRLKRFLFERCKHCGRRFPWGYAPVSHQWDHDPAPWFKITAQSYHHECSSVVSYRRYVEQDTELVGKLLELMTLQTGKTEAELVESLTGHKNAAWEWYLRNRLQFLMGYERDDEYELVKREK